MSTPPTETLSIVLELITPDKAREYLATSNFNRPIRERVVTSYSATMARREWEPYPGLVFNSSKEMCDGHHRCYAVIKSDTPTYMYVVRGVSMEAQRVMDINAKRGLAVQLKMYHPKMSYIKDKVAAVHVCAYLLSGTNLSINTITEFNHWYSIFKPGLDWAVTSLSADRLTRTSTTLGGLAFAYKTDPAKLQEFGERLGSGTGLRDGDPALALRKVLGNRLSGGGTQRLRDVRRVLNAAMAHVNGDKVYKLSAIDAGRQHFKEAYDGGRKAKAMTAPWVGPETQDPDPGQTH